LLLQDGRSFDLDHESDLSAGILAVCSLPKNEPPAVSRENEPPAVSRELVGNASGYANLLQMHDIKPWTTCPDLPIEAELLQDAKYWLENIGMLLNQDGIPIRMGSAEKSLSYRILTGECTKYNHDTSLRRYKLMEGLLRFGYPEEKAIALGFHLGHVGHKAEDWQLRDSVSIFMKVRAELGAKYRPTPCYSYNKNPEQHTLPTPSKSSAEAAAPRPRGRPRTCPDVYTVYEWLLERIDASGCILAGGRSLAAKWHISHRSWRDIERKLADEGLVERITPRDKRLAHLIVHTVSPISPDLPNEYEANCTVQEILRAPESTVRETEFHCAENPPGEADAQCNSCVFRTAECAAVMLKNVSPHARTFGAPPFPPNPQEADSLSPTPPATPVSPASPDDAQAQPASPDDDYAQPASPDDDYAQPASPVSPASPDDDGDTSNPILRDLVADALDAGCKRKSQVVWYVQANSSQPFSEQAITYWLRRERQERSLAAEIEEATPAALVKKISACDSHIAASHKRRDQGYRYWQYRRVRLWEALERRGYDPVQELDRLLDEQRGKRRRKRRGRTHRSLQESLPGL
jgi:hypothetical protein